MDRMSDVFDRMLSEGVVSGPSSLFDIDNAEMEIGARFPAEYRDLLGRYGAIFIQGVTIYGLPAPHAPDESPLWTNVVEVTKLLRQWKQIGTEEMSFVPFSDEGSGVYFFFNCAASPRTEIWAIGPGIRTMVVGGLYDFAVGLSRGHVSLVGGGSIG